MEISLKDTFSYYHFELTHEEIQSFEQFLDLFIEYNSHTNLSSIRERVDIIEKHFIDSLEGGPIINQYIEEDSLSHPKLLDLGSGGGFPGIPLKITLPEVSVTLLDSVGKKVKAMEYFVRELSLVDIKVAHGRAESLGTEEEFHAGYDFVVSRATAYVKVVLPWCLPFLRPNGKILLYKSPSPEERKDMEQIMRKLSLTLERTHHYTIRGSEREIFVLSR